MWAYQVTHNLTDCLEVNAHFIVEYFHTEFLKKWLERLGCESCEDLYTFSRIRHRQSAHHVAEEMFFEVGGEVRTALRMNI